VGYNNNNNNNNKLAFYVKCNCKLKKVINTSLVPEEGWLQAPWQPRVLSDEAVDAVDSSRSQCSLER